MNNRSMARALTGPVVLITIGVLFALDNFMQLPFSRTWPVILIVLGLVGLIRHWAGRADRGPASGAGPSSRSSDLNLARPQDHNVEAQPGSGAAIHEPPRTGDTL